MILSNWFQFTPIPNNVMTGVYNLKLVALSYIIAILASYVALDLAGRLQVEKNPKAKLFWLLGGSFAMGAGIWSMHFIGMLAYTMKMPMDYDFLWTSLSLLIAILASSLALYILCDVNRKLISFIMGGILIGLGIASMHYMGMEAMTMHADIHYLPGLFFLSIAIAIIASEAALWLALKANQGSTKKQFYLKIMSSLIMGIAICGMHYTGMAAAVFTPLQLPPVLTNSINPILLAFFIAGVSAIIASIALTISTYFNALQNEKEFIGAMLNNLEDEIIACDPLGNITIFNDVFRKNLNIIREKNASNKLFELFNFYELNNKKPIRKENWPLFKALEGKSIRALELIMEFQNGMIRNVMIDGQPIININGNKLGAVIVIHDITEIRKTEKLKSEFISVVSHELRTPLTSIRGSLGLLLGGAVGEFSEKAGKLLEIANKNCDRLLILINDILDMEKIQAGKMKFDLKPVDIYALVNEAIQTNKMYGEKLGVQMVLSEFMKHIEVYVDPDRLLQVLANLISNAVKFSPKGGLVDIKISSSNNQVRVSVSDCGPGISLEFQSKIFQKFSQADSSDTRGKGGTGLGLNISKAIIEKMNGNINFISKPNIGATFYFELPIFQIKNEMPSVNPKAFNPMKLLICEDDESQANYLSVLLEGAGFFSDIANTAMHAKKLLAKNSYRAILLDLILPDQDGVSFIRELRKSDKTKNLPIIVLSMMAKDGKELLNGDAILVVDWLDKPINVDKLFEAISRIKSLKTLPHILHVEDDEDTSNVIAALLEKEARITTSSTVKETIQKLGHDTFDLVILDLGLPDGNGSDLLPILSKYNLPVIVYSANDLDQEFVKYATSSLIKSKISNNDLLSTIKKILKETSKEDACPVDN